MVKKVTAEASQVQQQPYDNLLKSLLEGQEKQMLPYFVPDAEYLETLNVEIVRTPLRVDRVYLVRHKGRKKIAHLEFESGPNNDMAPRLLDYHAYLYRKYKLPVLSMIVYPFPAKMAESPLREVDEDHEILTFHFRVFPLWQLKAEQYVNEHAVVMYALLPTMEGANASLLHKAIDEMVQYYQGNDTKLAQEFRWMGIVVRKVKTMPRTDKREIQERLNMWDDLMEKDPKMRKIRKESEAKGRTEGLKEGVEKGIKEGRTEGLKEGLAEGLRKAIVTAVRLRFPDLTELAQERVAQISKPEKLNLLVDQIAIAPDENMVRLLLDLVAA
jgi:predicted transposase YdaD